MSKTLFNLDADPSDPIIVVGGSYAGAHAARTLAKSLPPSERVVLLEQRSHLAHLYVLPRFAVVEGYEEHAFIPYTNIFATAENEAGKTKATGEQKEHDQAKISSDQDGGEKVAGDKKQETVSLQDSGPDHHPDQKLEDLPKEPRAEYIQSTVTRITTREVSFVRHHHHPRHHRIQTRSQEKASEQVEVGGTRKLGKRNGKKGQTNPIWKLETGTGTGSNSSTESTPVPTGSHIHLNIDGEPNETQTVDLLTPPPSKGNTPMQERGFTCCNDCISPSSGCCQASSVSPSTSHVHVITDPAGGQGQVGEGGLLTPQPSVEFKIDLNAKDSQQLPVIGRGKTMRARGCATCLSNSETCCQATSTSSSSSSSPSSSLTTDPNGIEPVAGGMQPPLPSLVKGAIEDEQEQAHNNNSNHTAVEDDEVDVTETIRFKYLVYATGSRLPHPLIRLPKKKMEAKDWLKENQKAVREATRVLVVGGGALGIQFASDIKAYFPTHHVILINSRSRFLSIYEPGMHDHIQTDLEALGVEVIHNERVEDLDDLERQRDDAARQEGREGKVGRRMVKTRLKSGAVIESDLQIICTGQKHNHELISQEEGSLLSDKGSLNVKSSMQLDHPDWNHVFAIGDVANTSAIKAGHTGWYQAGVAAANIVKMVKDGDGAELDEYTPTKPMIKVTVGKNIAVTQMWDEEGKPKVSRTDDLPEDLQAGLMWTAMGADTNDMSL